MALHKNSKLYRLKVAALQKARAARSRKAKARRKISIDRMYDAALPTREAFKSLMANSTDELGALLTQTPKDAPSSPFLARLEAKVRGWVRDELEAILGA